MEEPVRPREDPYGSRSLALRMMQRKSGVEAYVLKKVTKDLHLHPIPLALKWDHISNLELADPEFRTPACIDLLLGAEVFASILRDGW